MRLMVGLPYLAISSIISLTCAEGILSASINTASFRSFSMSHNLKPCLAFPVACATPILPFRTCGSAGFEGSWAPFKIFLGRLLWVFNKQRERMFGDHRYFFSDQLFNILNILFLLCIAEAECGTVCACTSGSSDPMNIGLGDIGNFIVDYIG